MGDADSEGVVHAHEIESWIDEALEAVDDGLDHLFLYMINVNERTKEILYKMRSLEVLRRVFIAMNVLMVPVILAILISFATRNVVDYSYELGFQILVTVLMFLSGSIGLPLYFFALWESNRCSAEAKAALQQNSHRHSSHDSNSDSSDYNSVSLSDDSFLTFVSSDEAAERADELSRMLANRLPEIIRLHGERRTNFPPFQDARREIEVLGSPSVSRTNSETTQTLSSSDVNVIPANEVKENINDALQDTSDITNPKMEDKSDMYEFKMVMDIQSCEGEEAPSDNLLIRISDQEDEEY